MRIQWDIHVKVHGTVPDIRCMFTNVSCYEENVGVCDTVRNIYLVSAPSSWHRAPKSLGTSWVTETSFALTRKLLMGSWIPSGWGRVTRKTKLSAPSPILQRGWVNDGSRSGGEASWKSLNNGVWRASGLVNTATCQERGSPQLHRDKLLCSGPF